MLFTGNLSVVLADDEDEGLATYLGEQQSDWEISEWYIDEYYDIIWTGNNDNGDVYAYSNVADDHDTFESLLREKGCGVYQFTDYGSCSFDLILIRGRLDG